jgi:hypothetical protein
MAVDRQITRASLTSKASIAVTFAGETPAQIARHRDIARRHQRRANGDGAPFIPRLRIAELQRVFALHYREKRLPDDDAGRADLRLMADHLAQIDPRLIRPWASTWMPTLPANELDALIADVGTGRRWKADALARELGLDDETRTRLKIKTIGAVDCSKVKRKSRRCRKRIAADRARRAKAGARPHAQSAESLMPWIEAGISRATYYRRRRAKIAASETVETKTRPIVRSTSIASGSADPERWEHGAEASIFDAKPLPSPSFRVHRPRDQAKFDPIVGLENLAPDIAFRNAHFERFRLIKAMPLDPKQQSRFAELDAFIEGERQRRALRREILKWLRVKTRQQREESRSRVAIPEGQKARGIRQRSRWKLCWTGKLRS